MGPPPVSVVVPTLGRPRELDRCLTALRQLRYRPLEVVVVACAEGQAVAARHAGSGWLRIVRNRGGGVGEARNDGIAAAAGEIVAFLDDDAVPEPTWLGHLVHALTSAGATAATGYVRGRNGISFQWRGRRIGRDGFIGELPDGGEEPHVPPASAGAPMLEGTNMAFRRDALVGMGGFDPGFRFYLDDADMALRLFDAGERVAIAPLAQVHHGFAPSVRRRADRMPTDLFDVGRSLALFLRKHHGPGEPHPVLWLHREGERRRLLRQMLSGKAEPRDVPALLRRFDAGVAEARLAAPAGPRSFGPAPADARFREDEPEAGQVILAGRPWSRRALRREAARRAADGAIVSLFVFSPTGLYHRVRFDAAGYWEQSGGLFGRADRSEPLFRVTGFRARVQREVARVAKMRGLPETDT